MGDANDWLGKCKLFHMKKDEAASFTSDLQKTNAQP